MSKIISHLEQLSFYLETSKSYLMMSHSCGEWCRNVEEPTSFSSYLPIYPFKWVLQTNFTHVKHCAHRSLQWKFKIKRKAPQMVCILWYFEKIPLTLLIIIYFCNVCDFLVEGGKGKGACCVYSYLTNISNKIDSIVQSQYSPMPIKL